MTVEDTTGYVDVTVLPSLRTSTKPSHQRHCYFHPVNVDFRETDRGWCSATTPNRLNFPPTLKGTVSKKLWTEPTITLHLGKTLSHRLYRTFETSYRQIPENLPSCLELSKGQTPHLYKLPDTVKPTKLCGNFSGFSVKTA